MPIASINGDNVVNSGDIILKLKPLAPKASDSFSLFTDDTDEWMKWSETKLAVMLYPNITRNFDESWEAFSYTKDVESWGWLDRWSNRILGPVAMYFANNKIKAKYNIMDERKALKELLLEWTNKLDSNNSAYLHGDHITMPDLMVYGVLHSISGMKTFTVIMEENRVLMEWYQRVDKEVIARTAK